MNANHFVGVGTLVICLLFLGAWLVHRALTPDRNASVSVEHEPSDHAGTAEKPISEKPRTEKAMPEQPLTEQMAIELTRKALEEKGYNVSTLAPVEYWHDYSDGYTERLFARNTLDENDGYVLWGPAPGGSHIKDGATWTYKVSIKKSGSDVECRVYRNK